MSIPESISTETKSVSHHAAAMVSAGAEDRWDLYARLAKRFGTPLYLYDAAVIGKRIAELRSFLPNVVDSEILFSFKSNPNPSVVSEMRRGGCRADLTSVGEISSARSAGFDFSQALYGGPGKSIVELETAITAGIRSFSMESRHDLEALRAAAEKSQCKVRVLIRINPQDAPKAKLAMSGVPSQFGFEESELREKGIGALGELGEFVRLAGVHIYWGTQIAEAESLLDCFQLTVKIAEEVSEALEFPLEVLNLGGGFPWPYATIGEGADLSSLQIGLADLASTSGKAAAAEWWFESGRFLCASSGTLIASVMETKESKGKHFLILDTGIHHLGGMSGLGRIPRFSIDIEVPEQREGNEEIEVDVVGQLCTPLDCIGRRLTLPRVERGDLIAIPNTGAYGATASVTHFLSRQTPVEVLHREGEVLDSNRIGSGYDPVS
ncbi:MAG: hypothetical protein AAGC68_04495 [Verrucomicrobiota bacterium]